MDPKDLYRFRLNLDINVMVASKEAAEHVTRLFHTVALIIAQHAPVSFDPNIFAREGDDGQEPAVNETPSVKEVSKTAN